MILIIIRIEFCNISNKQLGSCLNWCFPGRNAQCELQYTHFFLPGNLCVFFRDVQCELQYTERWDKDRWIFFSITYSA